jgi:hypothetical protein
MKTTKHLLVAAVAAVTLTLSAQAGEPLLSPRAKELADSLRKVPSSGASVDLARNIQYGNAKARELTYSLRKVPSTGPSIDLAHAPRPTLSPKDPRYETALRANATREFQIAPLK